MSAALALAAALFFDDFNQPDLAALRAGGWTLRDRAGHPGIPGARWDPARVELPGQGLLRLHAGTDGTPAGSFQSQLCRPQQFLWGSTSARVRFSDLPLSGPDGDSVVQAFFQVSPLRFDYDPLFSELDWEYLPNGGWGAPDTRLYGVAWQTVRLEPWDSHNLTVEDKQSFGGRWVQLTVQATPQGSRWFVDEREIAFHAGRTVPRQAMGLAFSHWFSPGNLLAAGPLRQYAFDVDWVLHVAGEPLGPQALRERVQALREQGVAARDTLPPAASPPSCDF